MNASQSLSAHDVRVVAVTACVCERTVRRYLAKLPVRSTCKARIEQALAKFPRN